MKRDLKVIYTSYQPYALQLGIKMSERFGWKPLYWFSDPFIENEIRSHFPDAITHNYIRAIRGIWPSELQNIEPGVVDETLLNALAADESIALNMMERNDSADSFKYRERLALYHRHLGYWTAVLDRLQPDIIVFEEEPHQAVDYVLYALAKLRNIETVMFIRTSFFGRMFPVKRFETGSAAIREAYAKKLASGKQASTPLVPEITQFLTKLKGSYEEVRRIQLYDQVDRINELKGGRPSALATAGKQVMRAMKIFNLAKFSMRAKAVIKSYEPDYGSDQKVPGEHFSEGWFSRQQSAAHSARTLKKKLALRDHYENIAVKDIDQNEPYIICALSYQPEKTTSPMGGHYVNQLLMVELLRKAMPPSWKLYVKDHISQFSWYTQFGEQHRSEEFYNRINAMPNTALVPLFYDTFALVDYCRAVATITGSIGFEAVIRQKPVLTFGHPWYKFCEGVFYSGVFTELKEQIDRIASGYVPDSPKVDLFIETVQEHTFEGIVGGRNIVAQAGPKGKPGLNAEEHVKAIESIFTS